MISARLASIQAEATKPIFRHAEPRDYPGIELRHVYALVATKADRAEMLEAVDEYAASEAAARDLPIQHLAENAYAVLKENGCGVLSEETFRDAYLLRAPAAFEHSNRVIDLAIRKRLETKAQVVIARIQAAAIADLSKHAEPPPAEAELAVRYGLPVPDVYSPVYTAIRAALKAVEAESAKPLDLSDTAFRRDRLSGYFKEPL